MPSETSGRPSVNQVLMDTAVLWASRSTCDRGHVGAVISINGRIISTGYNGAPGGLPHCDHSCTCDVAKSHMKMGLHADWCPANLNKGCQTSVHAEMNAIAFGARHGMSLEGSTLHTTHSPCVACAQLIINAGIRWVYYLNDYRITDGRKLLERVGIEVHHWRDMIEP